jgi:hypothetical protein
MPASPLSLCENHRHAGVHAARGLIALSLLGSPRGMERQVFRCPNSLNVGVDRRR